MKIFLSIVFSAVVLTFVACSPNKPAANNPPPNNSSAANTASSPMPPAAVKEDLTPPDTALTPVQVEINGVKYSLDAPPGAVVEPSGTDSAIIKFGTDSQLRVSGPSRFDQPDDKNPVAKSIKWWKDGGGIVKPKSYLIDEPDEYLVESKDIIDETKIAPRRYDMKFQKKFDDFYISVALERQTGAGGVLDRISTKDECLLALKCARSIKRAEPAN